MNAKPTNVWQIFWNTNLKNQMKKDQEKWLNLGNLQYPQNVKKTKSIFIIEIKLIKTKVLNWKLEN